MMTESYSLTPHPLQLKDATEQRRDEEQRGGGSGRPESQAYVNCSSYRVMHIHGSVQGEGSSMGRLKPRGKPMTMAVAEHLLLS